MSVLARAQITIIVINDGPTGPTGKRMLTGMVHYQLSNASAPAKPSATAFNFSTRVFSGLTANWAIDSPVYASGNANKYWYCTYTVEESTSGSGTGTPVFGTVKQAIGFSGLVTFTGDQSVTDGTKTLSFGATGTTKIDGGNIETGTVSADRIDVDNLTVRKLLTPIDSLNARVEIKEPTTADPYARITITGADASIWTTYLRMFVESAAESGLDSPSAALEITTNYGTNTSTRGKLTVEGIEAYKVWGKNNPATSSGLSSMYKYYGMIVKYKSSGGEYAVKINITYNEGTGTIDFILDGLPTANPGGSVTVWKDSKGFLRIGAAVAYTAADVGAVPTTRTVNSKALSADISLTAADVGAVPTTRTVNSKALSADITLSAADVGALPSNTIQYFTQAQWNALTQAEKDAVPLALVEE